MITADQLERACLLRRVGLSFADIAVEVHANRETIRMALTRLGVVPRTEPLFSKPASSENAVSMEHAPPAASRQNGWATVHAMREVMARRYPFPQPMTEADHREWDSKYFEDPSHSDLDG